MISLAAECAVLLCQARILALPAVLLHIKEAETKRAPFAFLIVWRVKADLDGLLKLGDCLPVRISERKVKNDGADSSRIGKERGTVDGNKVGLQLTSRVGDSGW